MMSNFYVYAHFKRTNDEIFYIGKGKGRRYRNSWGRNNYWNNIVAKHGFYSKIMFNDLNENCAFSIEKLLIFLHKDLLCNLTDGGEGCSGRILTSETKKKIGEKNKLKVNSEEQRKILIERVNNFREKGLQNRRKKVINSDGEIFNSLTEAANAMQERNGGVCAIAAISRCCLGKSVESYGLSWSYDITKIPKHIVPEQNKRKVKCIEKDLIFDSVQDATRWVASWRGYANNSYIGYSIKNGWKAFGYKWEYI